MDNRSDGQIAYEAYVKDCGGRSIHGEQLPSWDGQAPEIRRHWEAAARTLRGAWAREAVGNLASLFGVQVIVEGDLAG